MSVASEDIDKRIAELEGKIFPFTSFTKLFSLFLFKLFQNIKVGIVRIKIMNWLVLSITVFNFFFLKAKKAKRLAKDGEKVGEQKEKVLDASKPITLDFLTNPNKEWIQKIKMSV